MNLSTVGQRREQDDNGSRQRKHDKNRLNILAYAAHAVSAQFKVVSILMWLHWKPTSRNMQGTLLVFLKEFFYLDNTLLISNDTNVTPHARRLLSMLHKANTVAHRIYAHVMRMPPAYSRIYATPMSNVWCSAGREHARRQEIRCIRAWGCLPNSKRAPRASIGCPCDLFWESVVPRGVETGRFWSKLTSP